MNNNSYCHKYLKTILRPNSIVLDATSGNGNDTVFLCRHCRFVYAMDIQEIAIRSTEQRLQQQNFNNYQLIQDNFINQEKYIPEKLDLIIYNLGFLPNHNQEITTKSSDFIQAFQSSINLLKDGAYLVISFYFHPEGFKEFYAFQNLLTNYSLTVVEKYQDKGLLKPILYILKK